MSTLRINCFKYRILPLCLAMFCCSSWAAENDAVNDLAAQSRINSSDLQQKNAIARNNIPAANSSTSTVLTNSDLSRIEIRASNSVAPAWAALQYSSPTSVALEPFGTQLFKGRFAGTFSDSTANDYVIAPGDRVEIRIWGARTFEDVVTVDLQGNLFIPEIGPIKIGGSAQSQLASKVESAVHKIYSGDVYCYVNLQSAQPVAVFVTGFVNYPGRYAGGSMDPLLAYLDRAGGINAERGSYRNISVRRNGKTIEKIDLYKFLVEGTIPSLRLKDGDVIVVGKKAEDVSAYGLVREQARYEFRQGNTGSDLMELANPLPRTSHVSITGIRNQQPFNTYIALENFKNFKLSAGDVIEFLADKKSETITALVSGAFEGQSRYPISRGVKLRALLSQIAIDPELADLDAIYLKRRSVARDQKKVIADSLQRLEQNALTASSSTPEEAQVRAQEAQLIQDFVKRARNIEPDGVVVVTRGKVPADIYLEDGDEIVIPQKSDVVMVTGEVTVPKAITYEKGMSIDDYLASAGGVSQRADENNILVAKKNGEVGLAEYLGIAPGDRIMVLPKVETKGMLLAKDVMQIIYQIAVATKIALDI